MSYLHWMLRVLLLPFDFTFRVLKASAVVAREILSPGCQIHAGFVEVPVRSRTDVEIALIAIMITLTPGTVTVSVRKDPATLWVHGMHIHDVDEFRAEIAAMEARMLGALRRHPAGAAAPAPANPTAGGAT